MAALRALVDRSAQQPPLDGKHDAFFYGTLIHPAVLRRIIGRACDLPVSLAILPGYTAQRVHHAEYPALVSLPDLPDLLAKSDRNSHSYTRGVLVKGLSAADVLALDTFEGDEYARTAVELIDLGNPQANDERLLESLPTLFEHLTPERVIPLIAQHREALRNVRKGSAQGAESVPTIGTMTIAHTYVWRGDPASENAWEWETFVKQHAHRWVSGERN
ncbi:hypothetical protein IE81DRAFT_340100 [Ceraceosorus guamensis]|uniref:Putative gamma-glutamylcyclotransferase n=1 Tax=Ceraceosorus guamensis TaxID=1522189 RepID=A0A316W4H5_9BASI|nr:hypothetical protein IE81DRAFT_340100 [Ceraceosorus guamensis]PWN44454.1 hypothetical protein IE81DRAFT_340100 [Ceraceosorus guamensis]